MKLFTLSIGSKSVSKEQLDKDRRINVSLEIRNN